MHDGVLTRLRLILTDPARAMAMVRERPRWAVGALICLLAVGLMSATTIQITGPEQIDLMKDTKLGQAMSDEQLDEQYARFEEISTGRRIAAGVQAGLGILVTLLFLSALYHLAAKITGGQGGFRHTLGIVCWANIVGLALASLVKIPLVLARGSSMDLSFGPALLVADRGPLDALFQVLSLFDLFTVWTVVLVVVGFEQVHGLARGRAAAAVVTIWLLVSLVMIGIGRLFI